MEENNCNRGAQSRLPLVGPGDQNPIRKETLAAGSLRSRPPGSFFNEKMLRSRFHRLSSPQRTTFRRPIDMAFKRRTPGTAPLIRLYTWAFEHRRWAATSVMVRDRKSVV